MDQFEAAAEAQDKGLVLEPASNVVAEAQALAAAVEAKELDRRLVMLPSKLASSTMSPRPHGIVKARGSRRAVSDGIVLAM